jgi:hypothetical protein
MTVQVSFISLSWKSWRDMHDLGAVLDYEEGLPHPASDQAQQCAGSSARRRHASAHDRRTNARRQVRGTTRQEDEPSSMAGSLLSICSA